MTSFTIMDRHLDVPRTPNEMGRLVMTTQTSFRGWMPGRIASDPRLGHRIADALTRRIGAAVPGLTCESEGAMARLRSVKPSTRRALFQRLERARGHLHDNDGRAVSLAELASVAGLSQFHLARYFKLAYGTAPIAYHRALRLERAAGLLISNDHSLIEIAELTGYSDEVALSHAFRRHFGKPPQLWAKEHRRA